MYVMVDIEANGPVPGLYSMFWFGAVVVTPELDRTYEGRLQPLEDAKVEDGENNMGYKLAGVNHMQVSQWPKAWFAMEQFDDWLTNQKKQLKDDRLMLISDNNGYDAMWISWYFHRFMSKNPFGHSSTNLGSLYKGLVRDTFKNFKHLRRTKHTHNPVDDAMGNAEALLTMKNTLDLKIKL